MLTTNLAFEEWTEIFGSERLTSAYWTGSLTGATSWERAEKVTDCDKPGKDLPVKPPQTWTQTKPNSN